MQMAGSRRTMGAENEASGSGSGQENRPTGPETRSRSAGANPRPEEPLPGPPPFTPEQFFANFLGNQHNMENLQRNMEATLRYIAANTHRGANPGGQV